MEGRALCHRERLGILDEAIIHLDSSSEPWSVHLEVQLRTRLDETRLRRAVKTALERHPRARARVTPTSGWRRRDEWRAGSTTDRDPFDVLHCDEDQAVAAAREELQSRPIALETSPPLRLRLVRHPGGDLIMLNLHHAAGDGMAALVLLQSVARAYAGRPEEVPDAFSDPVVNALPIGRRRSVLGELGQGLLPSTHIVPDGGREAPGYAFHLLEFDAARTRALRERARDGVTVNDLLVTALHLTVERWNAAHGKQAGRISVLVPVNLRSRRQWRQGFTNRTFMVPVATLGRDRRLPGATVDAVRRRTRTIKEQQTPAAVVRFLQRLQSLPRAARRRIARRVADERLMPTTLLSNLGPVEHDLDFGPGAGCPTDVWFSPPARMPLGLAIGALTADERLHLAFRVRHPLLGPEALAGFAATYESVLDGLTYGRDRVVQPPAVPARAA